MKSNTELTYIDILSNEYHPHYSHYSEYIFKELSTNKLYYLSLNDNFSISGEHKEYAIDSIF